MLLSKRILMSLLIASLQALSIAAFFFYGVACLFSAKLIAEFKRYQLERWRCLVGSLEIAGALGLLAGWFFPIFTAPAAAGLTALMACGLWARWRIQDPWYAMLPAFVLGLINLLIFFTDLPTFFDLLSAESRPTSAAGS